MHTRSKHKDNNNITGEESLNNKDTHDLDHIEHKTQDTRNKEKQQETKKQQAKFASKKRRNQ